MTDSEHAALSAELARALGWKYVYPHSRGTTTAWFRRKHDYVAVSDGPGPRGTMLAWRKFDYRDPTVCMRDSVDIVLMEAFGSVKPDTLVLTSLSGVSARRLRGLS